jgi:Cu-Zn family superoxide dismutase
MSFANFYQTEFIQAVAVFQGPKIKGTVYFTETNDENIVEIKINLEGLRSGHYGFHIHEAGDLTDGCTSACAHFNPFSKNHGCPGSKERHVGDLGNVVFGSNGKAQYSFFDDHIRLRGYRSNIIGRSVVIHESPDDCGLGGNTESLKTGNAGKRLACAVIGYSKNCK